MCGVCGCETEMHTHGEITHQHASLTIPIHTLIFEENNRLAALNRNYFMQHQIAALNLMSSPGSGKSTLLHRTFSDLKQTYAMSVIVGDLQTDHDAKLIRQSGAQVLQVNTGQLCHLDAHHIAHAIHDLKPNPHSILFIENIGNLVCPALFDLGARANVVLCSVTEGENKPQKYPDMFRTAELMLLTKMDLLPYLKFDTEACIDYARSINPKLTIIKLSASTGLGLDEWYDWLSRQNP